MFISVSHARIWLTALIGLSLIVTLISLSLIVTRVQSFIRRVNVSKKSKLFSYTNYEHSKFRLCLLIFGVQSFISKFFIQRN
jgi:hypothetical protein